MAVRRNANFGTYFFVGVIGLLIGSVIGKALIRLFKSEIITQIISLNGIAYHYFIQIGNFFTFTFNLFAIIGIILAIYIYRRI